MPFGSSLKLQALSIAGIVLITAAGAQSASVQTNARPSVRITAKIDNAVTQTLPMTHPQLSGTAKVGARLSAAARLPHLRLVLTSSVEQEAALQQLMAEQQDKTSANFHKWLTPDTFGAYFGPAQADIAKVSAWLGDQGMTVESVAKSGRVITFSANAGQVETAFHTHMNAVTVGGKAHVANTTDVAIPQALAGVVAGIARLNDIFPAHNPGRMSTVQLQQAADGTATGTSAGIGGPTPLYGTSTGTHYVTPGDAANIYNTTGLTGASSPIDGTGVTVAVLAQSNVDIADVQKFRSMFGLVKNDPTVTIVGSDPGENQDDVEAFLDIEWAGAMAPKATVNFLVSQPTLEDGGVDAAAQYAVENNIGDIISLSYGGGEPSNGATQTAFFNNLWEQAAAQGQTVFVSSGDSGAAGCDSSGNTYATAGYCVNALGSSAYNVAMGGSIFIDFNPAQYWGTTGTVIPFVNALSYIPEGAVNQGRLSNDYLNAGSTAYQTGSGIFSDGGGISIYTARPSWQTGSGIPTNGDAINVYSGTGIAAGSPISGLHRLVPDLVNISANGHDGTLFCAGSICSTSASGTLTNAGIVGGTSVATPVQAGMQALINQKNGGRQGNILPILYALSNAQYTASTTACQATIGTTSTSTPALPASTCNFHDVIAGTNVVPTAATGTAGIGFSSGVGFDEASGLGSMNVTNVATNWSTVSLVPTTTTFTLSPTAGITHGATQNLAATVVPTTGTGTPTGDIALIASTTTSNGPRQYTLTAGTFSGTVASAANNGTSVGALAALPAGNYSVYVHYAGDGTYAPSNSTSLPVSIAKETSATSVSSYNITPAGSVNNATNFAYGASVYLDTYVTASSGAGIPTGTVTYSVTQNGTALAPLTTTLDPTGNTFLLATQSFVNFYLKANYTALSPGSYVVTAAYSGDASYASSTTTSTFTIAQLTPTVTFTGPVEIASGSTAVFAYKIASLNTTGNPNTAALATGTVTFTDTTSATVLGTCTLVTSSCSFSTTGITAAGANTIQAVYSGDSNYAATTSTTTVTVGTLTASTVTLTNSGSLVAGGILTLKATLNPTTATGTVSFFDGSNYLGVCTLATGTCSLANGTAATGGGPFTAGTHAFSATYSGSTTYASSTGTLSATVTQNVTTLSYFGVPANSTYGLPVTFSVAIVRAPTTSIAALIPPTGVVNFYIDGGTTPVAVSGQPAFDPAGYGYYFAAGTATQIPAGNHTVTATYVGDANFKTSSNTTGLPLTVAMLTPTIVLSSPATVYNGATSVTLTATIPGTSTLAAPSGLITFYDGVTSLGSATASYSSAAGGFTATFTATGLMGGTHSFKAVLTSDANYASATSNTLGVLLNTNNVWVANGNGTVSGITNSGTAVTSTAQSGGGTAIAIDNAGDVWSLNKSGSTVSEYSNVGILISGGSTVGGLNAPTALAIDGAGLVWVTNGGTGTLSVLSAPGTAVSATAYKVSLSTPSSISIDATGNLWITNTGDNSVTEVFGAATPVTTPTSNAVKNNALAAKP